jgi:hypothetical protein
MEKHIMRHTDQPEPRDPTSPGSDLPAMIVRGALAVIFGCGATVIFLFVLAFVLSLFLG